jgi:hypothetical protein
MDSKEEGKEGRESSKQEARREVGERGTRVKAKESRLVLEL